MAVAELLVVESRGRLSPPVSHSAVEKTALLISLIHPLLFSQLLEPRMQGLKRPLAQRVVLLTTQAAIAQNDLHTRHRHQAYAIFSDGLAIPVAILLYLDS